jgi:hypothetical protein
VNRVAAALASLLGISAVLVIITATAGATAAASCLVPVTGGTAREQAAVQRILCKMRGTTIESVQILGQPPDAPNDALWLAVSIPRPTTDASNLTYVRAKWEENIAAGAIRDGFVRLGFPRVIGYEEVYPGVQPDTRSIAGIALRDWNVPRWATGGRPHPRGGRVETWPQLQAKLDLLSRRFGVRTRLDRYEPFGKAPLVTILTGLPTKFILAGGFDAYKQALHFNGAHFDGVLLRVVTPALTGVQIDAVYRGRPGSGCSVAGHIKHSSKICQGD